MSYIKSIIFFIVAGFCEIGGGYLVWLWIKEGKPIYYGITGFVVLALYGVAATLQTSNFARTYATYGGVFIVMSLIWAWKMDGFNPDKFDITGAIVALAGVGIIMYAPRR